MHFFISLCGISLFVVVLANEYCFEELCIGDKPHIACDHTGEFADNCPEDAELIDMNPYKLKILNELNIKRNALALGKIRRFASASRMATMTWDDELADLAAMNVQRCEMSIDCHNTETYKFSAQNVFTLSSIRRGNIGSHLTAAIDTWWSRNENCTRGIIDEYQRPTSQIGQFTCLASELNTAVGCAIATYSLNRIVFLLTCNFANCNVIGQPIYRSGPTASDCTTGVNPKYRGLCSEDEEFEINFIY